MNTVAFEILFFQSVIASGSTGEPAIDDHMAMFMAKCK